MPKAGVIQTFGINDLATADMLSRTIGDTTILFGKGDRVNQRPLSALTDPRAAGPLTTEAVWKRLCALVESTRAGLAVQPCIAAMSPGTPRRAMARLML